MGTALILMKFQNMQKKKIILIEDCAQSIGSFLNSQHCGTFGDIGIFSFHSHKNMTTLGEGGMIVTKISLLPILFHSFVTMVI